MNEMTTVQTAIGPVSYRVNPDGTVSMFNAMDESRRDLPLTVNGVDYMASMTFNAKGDTVGNFYQLRRMSIFDKKGVTGKAVSKIYGTLQALALSIIESSNFSETVRNEKKADKQREINRYKWEMEQLQKKIEKAEKELAEI